MSRADDTYYNVFFESYFSRMKAGLLEEGAFGSGENVRTEIFEYIELYYKTKRRNSSLNYHSLIEYENQYFYSLI